MEKLKQGTFPDGHGPQDFKCYGPPALKDGEFDGTMIGDMGCFIQNTEADGEPRDSNKYYHGAVVSGKADKWFAYFEWGRTGATPAFQFFACCDRGEAEREFVKQMRSKNDKRGEWVDVPRLGRVLRPKPDKDCYLVRPQATRSTGLPAARTIVMAEDAKIKVKPKSTTASSAKKVDVDPQTIALLRDIKVATTDYARGAMSDACLPTQAALDEARIILDEATGRVGAVGASVEDQLADRELRDLTNHLYGRIPKRKERGAPPSTWLLTQDNILLWRQDLDAFEAALSDQEVVIESDPYGGMPIEMHWIDPKSDVGKFIYDWAPPCRGAHHYGALRIKNVWRVKRGPDASQFEKKLAEVAEQRPKISAEERARNQPGLRPDLSKKEALDFARTHTCLLFHGTRSVNVSGILRTSFRLPKELKGVVITGAMFGPGVYYASMWTKSAGYTSLGSAYYGGGGAIRGRGAFMFMNDVILGKPFIAPGASGYVAPPKDHHSIFGKAGASGVQNDEHIIFDTAQHCMRYLMEFEA